MKLQLSLLLACTLFAPRALVAQDTAFTYQGRLNHDGSPANGQYEISFSLFDAVTNGAPVGTPITIAPVPVSNGLFTATLDFGAAAGTRRAGRDALRRLFSGLWPCFALIWMPEHERPTVFLL